MDAVNVAGSYGISPTFSQTYSANSIGVDSVYNGVSITVSSLRTVGEVKKEWKENIQ